mmetsp:Transcript_21053/g.40058  ORF Transcript_21053/g.40058 Transcript_21053/m.40058 type:complete len:791 (-) Transcript_21053:200-2572(-)
MSVMDDVPLTFSCPITGEIFCDPVVISDGHTYERSAILKWLKRNDSSPITREKIAGKSILPNFVVKTLLDEWPKNQLHGNMMDSSIHQVEDGAVVRYVRLEEVQLGLGSPPRGFYDSAQLGRWRGCDVGLYRHVHDAAVLLEARVMGRIGIHPYITTCHGVLRDADGKKHLVTDIPPCGSLAHQLAELDAKCTPVQPAVLLRLADQVCEAMQAVHHAGVVHRGLSAKCVDVYEALDPENPYSVSVKVGGFTHAQALEARAATSKMAGSKPVHTALQVKLLRHIAPESFAHDMWNEKSDVWSFGVLLWEVATMGAPPYASHGVEAADIQVKPGVCDGSLRLPPPPNMPALICNLLDCCWATDPNKRPSFAQLRLVIQDVHTRLEVAKALSAAGALGEDKKDASRSGGGGGFLGSGRSQSRTDLVPGVEEVGVEELLERVVCVAPPAEAAKAPGLVRSKGSGAWYDVADLQTNLNFPMLVEALEKGDSGTRERAAVAVELLCAKETPQYQVEIAKSGGCKALVQNVKTGDPQVVAKSALALRSLTRNTANQAEVASVGGIDALVIHLHTGSDEVKTACAVALGNLALSEANKVAIAKANGLKPLVSLLSKENSDEARAKAAGALWNLTVNDENKIAVAKFRGIEALIELTRNGNDESKTKAAATLWNLARNIENNTAIGRAGGVGCLVGLVRFGTPDCKANAAGALWTMTVNNLENMTKVVGSGGIQALVELMRTGNAAGKAKASATLYNLARDPNNKDALAMSVNGSSSPKVDPRSREGGSTHELVNVPAG